jgi:hypothetical protein
MRTIKLIFVTALIISISSVVAQEDVTNNDACNFYNTIYNNVNNGFVNIKGKKIDTKFVISSNWETTIPIPKMFSNYYLDIKNRIFNVTLYNGTNKAKAEKAFVNLIESITKDCSNAVNKEFKFLKDTKSNYLKTGKRDFIFTTTTENILIKIKLNKVLGLNDKKKIELHYEASVSFIGLKNKEKVINKILNK